MRCEFQSSTTRSDSSCRFCYPAAVEIQYKFETVIAQLGYRRVGGRKAADSPFGSRAGNVSLCAWKRPRIFPNVA